MFKRRSIKLLDQVNREHLDLVEYFNLAERQIHGTCGRLTQPIIDKTITAHQTSKRDLKEIEEFIRDKTFICKKLDAKITRKQCAYNCARALLLIKRHEKREGYQGFPKKMHRFFKPVFMYICYNCAQYKKPSKEALVKIAGLMYGKNRFYSKGIAKRFYMKAIEDDRGFCEKKEERKYNELLEVGLNEKDNIPKTSS